MLTGRTKLQALANARLSDAKALLGRKRWSGAYYLGGYAIELALKSRVLIYLHESDFVFGASIPKIQFREFWTHDLYDLAVLGGLKEELEREVTSSVVFEENWALVKDWSESSRYLETTENQADRLFKAIGHPDYGVLPWIQKHW